MVGEAEKPQMQGSGVDGVVTGQRRGEGSWHVTQGKGRDPGGWPAEIFERPVGQEVDLGGGRLRARVEVPKRA